MSLSVLCHRLLLLAFCLNLSASIFAVETKNLSSYFGGMGFDGIVAAKEDKAGNIQTVTDKRFIAQWVEQVNPKDFKFIIDHFTNVNKIGTVMDLDVRCSNCGFKEKTDVVVDITNFFSEED